MGLAQKLQQAQHLANSTSHALNSVPGAQKPGGYPPAPGGYPAQQGGHSAQQHAGQHGAYPGQQPPQQGGGYPGQQPSHQAGGYPGQQPSHQAGGYPGQQPSHQAGGYPGQQPSHQTGGYPGQQPPAGQYGAAPAGGQYGSQPPAGQYGAPSPCGQYGSQPPAGQYCAPQHGGSSSNTGTVTGVLQNKLRQMIQVNRLESFYPPNSQQLNQVFAAVDRVDFRAMAQRYSMPLELATDMVTLALYDVVIFCDDSGSMAFEEGGERINDLKVILGRVAEVSTLFDSNGINIRFMNGNVEGNNICDSASASNLVSQVQFNGLTPLGSKLDEKVIRPFVANHVQNRSLQKPVLVIVITDGEPTGEAPNTVLNVVKGIKNLVSNSQYGPGAVGIEFSQVGKDVPAQRFLATLDKDPQVGKMIDATSYYELEQEEYARKGVTLTPDLWLMKLMVGAVDPTFDEQD